MNLLMFPGNSKKSGIWLERVEEVMAPGFENTFRHNYEHWNYGTPEINLSREVKILSDKYTAIEPYIIFAKSAGTMLVLMAMSKEVIKPKACLFAGIPLVMVKNQDLPFMAWIKSARVPITIVQNDNDPYGGYDEVCSAIQLAKNPNIQIISLPGDTHDYNDLEGLSYIADDLKQEC